MSYFLKPATLRGLGFDYYDVLKSAGIEQCSPLDAECVASNELKSNAAHNLWETQYMTHPETANQPVPKITFDVNALAALNNQASNPAGTGYTTVTVNGQPIADTTLRQAADTQLANTIATQIRGGAPQNAATDAILAAGHVTVKPPAKAGAAAGAPSILGLQVEGSPAFTIPGTDVEVPALPWWVLALGAAGAAWFAFGRGK